MLEDEKRTLNTVIHEHLAVVLLILIGMAGTAVGFYWSTQIQVISDVSANTTKANANSDLNSEIRQQLINIDNSVDNIELDVAVIKEKVNNLEK